MFFDLFAETGSEPITLLNTTRADNSAFYGHALGTGSMELVGPQNDMFMQISAKASETDSSHISIPPQQTKSGGFADFMVERTHGHSVSDSLVISAINKMTYDIDLTADPHTTINVVLDELTGDSITARGRGSLNIRGGTTEPLSLNGSYFIEEGSYVYTFQSFFHRPFVLRKDEESYIRWNGDPSKATINFNAEYVAPKVSFAPIASGLSDAIASTRENVTVIVRMSGEMFHPNFDFKLEFPSSSVAVSDPILAFNLDLIEKDPNELNKQVTYLIVFNSFAPIGNQSGASAIGASGGLSGAATQLAYNTMSSLMFNEVNRLLGNLFAQVFKNDKLRLNVSGQLYNRNALNTNSLSLPDASNVNLVVSGALLKDRLIISAGSTMDIPLQAQNNTITATAQRFEFLPDVSAEYLVNANGSIRVGLFYKENLDLASDQTATGLTSAHNRRTGASLSLRKESDSIGGLFADIFNDIFHARKKKTPVTPPAETAITPENREKKNSANQ
jgi:hypothetical protein